MSIIIDAVNNIYHPNLIKNEEQSTLQNCSPMQSI